MAVLKEQGEKEDKKPQDGSGWEGYEQQRH